MRTREIRMFMFFSILVLSLAGLAQVSSAAKPAEMIEARRAEVEAAKEDRAVERDAAKEDRQAALQQQFCDQLTQTAERLQSRVRDRAQQYEDNRDTQEERLQVRRQERQQNLEENRSEADARRLELYAKLDDQATTEEQQDAVNQFQETVEEAIRVRRAAVDEAIDAFLAAVDEAVASRKATSDDLVASFNSSLQELTDAAAKECAAGTDAKTARENLQNSIKQLREQFQSQRKEQANVGEVVKQLAQVRQDAVKAALDTFHETLQQAQDELQATFPATVMENDTETDEN